MDWKLELVLLPVADVDVSKAFYTDEAGFNLDIDRPVEAGDWVDEDTSPTEKIRVVQLTPRGSACSIAFGTGITDAAPGSVVGLHLIVTDIVAARAELVERGVEVTEVRHIAEGEWVPGPDPEHADYNSFADFKDLDGNTWVLQEVGHKPQA